MTQSQAGILVHGPFQLHPNRFRRIGSFNPEFHLPIASKRTMGSLVAEEVQILVVPAQSHGLRLRNIHRDRSRQP